MQRLYRQRRARGGRYGDTRQSGSRGYTDSGNPRGGGTATTEIERKQRRREEDIGRDRKRRRRRTRRRQTRRGGRIRGAEY